MSASNLRPGVRAGFLVERSLSLVDVDVNKAEAIEKEIDGLMGVQSVSFDEDHRRLHIAYDAAHVQLDQIEAVVHKHQGELDNSWWMRFKRGWYRYGDGNTRDNAELEPFCCSKVPPGK